MAYIIALHYVTERHHSEGRRCSRYGTRVGLHYAWATLIRSLMRKENTTITRHDILHLPRHDRPTTYRIRHASSSTLIIATTMSYACAYRLRERHHIPVACQRRHATRSGRSRSPSHALGEALGASGSPGAEWEYEGAQGDITVILHHINTMTRMSRDMMPRVDAVIRDKRYDAASYYHEKRYMRVLSSRCHAIWHAMREQRRARI